MVRAAADDRSHTDGDNENEELIEGSRARERERAEKAKREREDRRWATSPSQAPLNSQESCVMS